MSLVVYTANFGPKDDKLRPPPARTNVRFVAFTDQEAPGWEVRPAFAEASTSRRTARLHKCLAHRLFPDAQATLWMDASYEPTCDLGSYVLKATENFKHDFCTFKHTHRVCLYQEIRACSMMKKDEPKTLTDQGSRYSQEGYPYFNGLCETGLVVRLNTPSVQTLNELWWKEIEAGSCRDQISLPYALWKLRRGYKQLPGRAMACPHGFKFHSHCFRFR